MIDGSRKGSHCSGLLSTTSESASEKRDNKIKVILLCLKEWYAITNATIRQLRKIIFWLHRETVKDNWSRSKTPTIYT